MKIKRIGVQMHCGECLHFTNQRLFEATCSTLGVDDDANAPSCFSPDPRQLVGIDANLIFSLGKILRAATSSQQRLLAHAVESAAELQDKTRYQFGQPVFIRLGEDVLSHYFKGYVVGLSSTGEQIIVSASLDNENRSSLLLFPDSLMTKREFDAHKEWLILNDKVMLKPSEAARNGLPIAGYYMPNATRQEQVAAFETYVPPTMESAPSSWFDKTAEVHDHAVSRKGRKLRKQIPQSSVRDLEGVTVESTEDGASVAL